MPVAPYSYTLVFHLAFQPRRAIGSSVRFKSETLLELLEVRRGLEMQSAFLAAQRRTDEDLAEMTAVLEAMREG